MKKRGNFAVLAVILAVIGLFTACEGPNKGDPLYTVSFNANGGTPAPQNQTVSRGGKVTEPEPMTRYGDPSYGFVEWCSLGEFGSNGWDFDVDTVTADITLYAQWLPGYTRTHTITFEANGGIPATSQQNIAYGSTVVTPPPVSKSGYGFGGWYKEADCINQWDLASSVVTKNITLYAKWDANYFTVNFEANGGTPAPSQQNIANGSKVVIPSAMTKTYYGFGGWYKEALLTNQWDFNNDVVTGNTTLYAKWETATVVPGASWNAKMRWLDTGVQSGGAYTIEIDSDESISPITFSYSGKNNININLKGIESVRTLSLSTSGSMFTVGAGVTLILGENLELRGSSSNSSSLIRVNSGANLVLNHGAKITGNRSSSGGGVYVNGGTFTMSGGEISGNTVYSGGGGVYVSSGTFTMNGGEISGNTASNGGGVYVGGGTFTMSGGEISGNTASGNNSSSGGGVYVASYYGSTTFTMSGGEISGNTASGNSSSGGGVYVGATIFNKTGGTIFGYSEDNSKSNTVKNSSGIVQQNRGHTIYLYHSNAIYNGMGKDTTSGHGDNLSFNGTVNPPSYSGEWDY